MFKKENKKRRKKLFKLKSIHKGMKKKNIKNNKIYTNKKKQKNIFIYMMFLFKRFHDWLHHNDKAVTTGNTECLVL